MKKIKLLKLLALFVVLITSINTVWAGEGFYGIYIKYNQNGTAKTSDGEWTSPLAVGTLTADFKVTDVYLKVWWSDWSPSMSGQLHYWKDGNEGWSGTFNNVKDGSGGSNNHEVYIEDWDYSLASTTEASGDHTITYKWEAYFSSVTHTLPDGSTKTITYTVNPPALDGSDFTVTPSNWTGLGDGTAGDPFIINNNSSTQFTVSADQAHDDDNSALWVKFGSSGTYSSSTTSGSYAKSADGTNVTIYAKYRNNDQNGDGTPGDAIDGAEVSKTIYYKEQPAGIYIAAGSNGQVGTDGNTWSSSAEYSPITLGNSYSIYAKANSYYHFVDWETDNENSTIADDDDASTTISVTSGAVTNVTANFAETMSTLSTACSYDVGTPGYSAPTVSGSATTVGRITTRTITAASAGTGYRFTGWTITNGARTDGGGETANPITVRSNGDGSAVTVTANYAEDLTSTWYLLGNNTAVFPGSSTWNTHSSNMLRKASGSSTGSVGSLTINVKTALPGSGSESTYQCKVYNSGASTWWGWNKDGHYWINSSNHTGIVMKNQTNNELYFIPDALGEYTFTVDWSDASPQLDITWPTSYAVNFSRGTVNGTNGSVSATYSSETFSTGTKVQSGKTVTLTAPAAKEGYTYRGWYSTNTADPSSPATNRYTDNASYTPTVSSAITAYACYTINNHTITHSDASHGSYTIKVGDASAVSTNTTSDYGKTITLSATPASGYHFTGWTVSKAGGGTVTPSSSASANPATFSMPDDNVTITATFAANTYTITLNDNDGSGGVGSATVTFDDDDFEFASEFAAPTRTGYIFQGYYTTSSMEYGDQLIDKDGNWQSDTEPYTYIDGSGNWIYANNMTLYAGWEPIKYTVTYHANGGSAKEGETDPTVTNWTYDEDKLFEVPTGIFNAPDGYSLYSTYYWNTSAHGDGTNYEWDSYGTRNLTSTDGDNIDMYAQWEDQITLGANYTSDYYSPSNGWLKVRYNQNVSYGILHTTRTGYLRTGYFDATSGGNKLFNADGTMVSGTVSGYLSSGYWVYEYADPSDPAPTVYAQWTPIHYDVIFDANDGDPYVGTATGSTARQNDVAYDTYVDLTCGFERTGYTFAGWSKTEHATSATYISDSWRNLSYTDGEDVTLYAVWAPNTYTITYNALEGEVLVPSYKTEEIRFGNYYGGGYSMPPVTPPAGYEFVGWFTRPTGGTQVTHETQMVSAFDHTLYAHYSKVNRVYFKNTLGWTNVYVTWDATWNHQNADLGAGSEGKTQELMSHIYGTDIWYKDIPAAYLSTWAWNIAFTSESMNNYTNFNKGDAVFRKDFDSIATMFVPMANDPYKFKKNEGNGAPGTVYYSSQNDRNPDGKYASGYWVSYSDLKAQYTLKGSWDSWEADHYIERPNTSDSVYVYTIKGLSANTDYTFKLWKYCLANTTGSVFSTSTAITSATAADAAICNAAVGSDNATFKTTVAGDYTFKFNFSKTGVVKLTIEYPFRTNDYRVVYSWNDGEDKSFSSEYIKASPSTKDTISMFIHSEDDVTAESRSLYIQKCTGITDGVASWNTSYATITLPDTTASGKTSGVYNFIIEQNESSDATGSYWKKYDGNYYIRTDSARGGWDMYKYRADNIMTLSEYSMTQTLSAPYSHYYCRFVHTADISYTIATDYSPQICPIMTGDATIGVGNTTLLAGYPASVRFSWNKETNALRRAYLKSAQGDGNKRFLVMHGKDDDMIFNTNGTAIAADAGAELAKNERVFADKENWVYELAIQAKPGAQVCLIAKYGTTDRYLVGDGDTNWETIIGGEGDTQYDISAVYDFKSNRLITAWKPSGTIAEALEDVEVLIERQYQGGGTTITFGKKVGESAAGSITAKRVIGALKFEYDDLVGYVANWTPTSRAKLMYFVSFPFDVNVSDIFGLNSAYGDAYIVQTYNGAKRAEKGFYAMDGTDTFWEDLPVDSVMHAGQGYCVVMDNEYMNGDIGHIWDNKESGDYVYLYFPSANTSDITINSDAKSVTLPAHQCKINRTFNGGKLNHKYTDSNWNVMGVPIFQNHTGSATSGTPGAIFQYSSAPADTTAYIDHPTWGFFYKWATDKSYTVTAASGYTFLPMHSYLVQYAGTVTFTCAAPVEVPASVAARRVPLEENYNIELQVLNSNSEMLNRTYVELRENAVDSFALNEDLFMITNNHAVNVYTFAGTYDVSANVLSIDNHIVPVGVIVKQSGTYTFSMPSNFSGSVTLVDTYANTRTNLALSDYTVDLSKGTNDERFYLEININQSPTSIDAIEDGSSLKDGKAHKFIENGVMYILRDGNLYDAQGNRVK